VTLLEKVKAEKARRAASASLYEFVKQSWHVVEPGIPFMQSWHIEEICEHLEAVSAGEIHRLLINIPPRHSKSTIVSVMWPAWEWMVIVSSTLRIIVERFFIVERLKNSK